MDQKKSKRKAAHSELRVYSTPASHYHHYIISSSYHHVDVFKPCNTFTGRLRVFSPFFYCYVKHSRDVQIL